jgi:uncharacterized protein
VKGCVIMVIDVNTFFGFWPKRDVDISVETLLKMLQDYQVDKACTLSTRGIYDDFKEGNDETLKICKMHKQLIPIATVNPAAYLGCYEEIRIRAEQGFKMFRFFPPTQEWNINGLVFRKVLDCLSQFPMPILLPASEGISNIFKVTEGMNNPIIITSFRYALLGEAIEAMRNNPNIFIETHMINSPDFLEVLKDEVGLEQIVFGSEAPLVYISSALEQVKRASISDDDKQKILGGNLKRILGKIQ